MINLFASFDLKLNSFIFICAISIFVLNFTPYYIVSLNNLIKLKFFYFLNTFFNRLNNKNIRKIFLLSIVSMIVLILYFNLVSMIPFRPALSVQLGRILYISLIFWFIIISFSLTKSIKGFLTHLIPIGTPSFLIPFIFLIELVRIIVRPITLRVRLVANVLAGHLLMTLLFSLCERIKSAFIFYIILNLIELGVGLIQSYIFVTLLGIYYSEI